MPKGLIWGLMTLILTGVLVTFLNMGIGGGAAYFGSETEEPLLEGLKLTIGVTNAKVLGLVAVAGLIASFHAIIYAFGRNIYSLSRAGYFPHWMSITHGHRKTPWVALLTGSTIGYGILLLLFFIDPTGSGAFGGVILNMAVFGAVVAYAMQMVAFIILRRRFAQIERPYRSPLGQPGAWLALVISLITLALLFANPAFRPGVIGVAIWFLAGIVYFAVIGCCFRRRKSLPSPEADMAYRRSTGLGIRRWRTLGSWPGDIPGVFS
jgi:ethanolamine permease